MEAILDFYNNTLGTFMPKELFCFLISMVPVLELRAGLVIASLLKIPIFEATLICVAGNVCIVPFALLFLDKLIWLLSHIKPLGKFFDWIKSKTKEKGENFEKGEFIGLLLFVGVPIPGTGGWTGCLLANLLGMKLKKAALAIILGMLMATAIMLIVSYGILGNVVH